MSEIPFKPIPEHLLHQWTMRLLTGEGGQTADEMAQMIIADFCTRVSLNQPPSSITLNWLADVLDQIMNAGKPATRRAFSLMPMREGGAAKSGEAIDIAVWIQFAIQRGYSAVKANELAAEVFHKDPKYIARQRSKASKWIDGIDPKVDDSDEYFKQRRRPLPAPIKRRGTTTH